MSRRLVPNVSFEASWLVLWQLEVICMLPFQKVSLGNYSLGCSHSVFLQTPLKTKFAERVGMTSITLFTQCTFFNLNIDKLYPIVFQKAHFSKQTFWIPSVKYQNIKFILQQNLPTRNSQLEEWLFSTLAKAVIFRKDRQLICIFQKYFN